MAQEDHSPVDLKDAGRQRPVLYSFRRCPYAMRARMAILSSGVSCELREVFLRDKPVELLAASPKGTVPVLVERGGAVIDQSLDIMLWALRRNDPEGWLRPARSSLDEMLGLIAACDGGFKVALDRYKYPARHPGASAAAHRAQGAAFLEALEKRLEAGACLNGNGVALADIAIAPFVRQFAQVDTEWFAEQPWPRLRTWLAARLAAPVFVQVMDKVPAWRAGQAALIWPAPTSADARSSSTR